MFIKKEKAIELFNKLNKVINGSQTVINTIDDSQKVNYDKCMRAAFLNNKILAETLKEVIIIFSSSYGNDKTKDIFSDIFKDFTNK